MAYNQKLESILALLSRKRTVTVSELSDRLEVSEVTIRKYLDTLEGEGIILRTRGGAMMAEDRTLLRPITMRESSASSEKTAIAQAARRLVSDGDTIYLDAGTTCRYLAHELTDMNLTVLTNSLDVINELAGSEGISLISPGGSFRRQSHSFICSPAFDALKDYRISRCFLGASGFTSDGCFYTQNLVEAQFKRQVIQVSKHRIVLADSLKFGLEAFSIFARPADLDILVTDSAFTGTGELTVLGIEVIIAAN